MDSERAVFSLSRIFFKRIEEEIDRMDQAGILVNEELLMTLSHLLKKEMQKYEYLPTELVDKAIDVAFSEIIKQRSIKH